MSRGKGKREPQADNKESVHCKEHRLPVEALTYLRRMILLALILSLPTIAMEAYGQTDSGKLKLYIEENSRLKQQKAELIEENRRLKDAQRLEEQRSMQLESNLAKVQPDMAERDRQLAEMNRSLQASNNSIGHWRLAAATIGLLIVAALMGMVLYAQRDAIGRQLRKLIASGTRRPAVAGENASGRSERQSSQDKGAIRPEEIAARLYGKGRRY